jgi:ribose/xylose/arabinose/galactoside ABC-type transport system permease subunit
VGSWFFPGHLSWVKVQHILDIFSKGEGMTGFQQSIIALGLLGVDATVVMLTGGILLAIPCALFGYYYSLSFFTKQRLKHP